MRNHLLHVGRVDRVEDREEVLSIWVPVFGIFIHEVLHHLGIITELFKYVPDSEFVVVWDVDELAGPYWHEGLIALKHLAHEIAIDGVIGRYIELHYIDFVRCVTVHLRLSLK